MSTCMSRCQKLVETRPKRLPAVIKLKGGKQHTSQACPNLCAACNCVYLISFCPQGTQIQKHLMSPTIGVDNNFVRPSREIRTP